MSVFAHTMPKDLKFFPKNITEAIVPQSVSFLPAKQQDIFLELVLNGWRFYYTRMAEHNWGFCYSRGVISINEYTRWFEPSKRIWILCHEMAHAFAGVSHQHDTKFMHELKRICPVEHIHWELDYKPANALKAGIIDLEALDPTPTN